MGYFAFRAAPMGPVGPAVVSANFANFQPAIVARALPDAWSSAMPDTCLRTRQDIATHALRSIGVDEHACRLAVELLAPAITSGDVTGRPLFAANAALPTADDPVTALWQTATTLREHRGDGHVAALACHGISGLMAHALQVANGRFSAEFIRAARGWSEPDWTDAVVTLRTRGLIDPDEPAQLTRTGRAALDAVETLTDEVAWSGALATAGVKNIDRALEVLHPEVARLWASGVIPETNPIGVPRS